MLRLFINIFILAIIASVQGFIIPKPTLSIVQPKASSYATQLHSDSSVGTETPSSSAATSSSSTPPPTVDAKEAVKIFGRLAEKYIMLDDSGGMCCYSACSDCEFRLPDGGYRMADQSAARPKWIPCYDERKFVSVGKEHVSNWCTGIFCTGPSVTKGEFVERVKGMSFSPPLGGPFVSASSAGIENDFALEKLFDLLAGDKEKLTRFRMGKRIKELGNGSEGLVWSDFIVAMTD